MSGALLQNQWTDQRTYIQMNKQAKEHRRNRSELQLYAPYVAAKPKKKEKIPISNPKKRSSSAGSRKALASTVPALLSKSSRKAGRKQIMVQQIDEPQSNEGDDNFFCFGRGSQPCRLRPMPLMEQIEQVPDTGSFSQRNTEDNKENLKEWVNRCPLNREKFFRLDLAHHDPDAATVSLMSQRQHSSSRKSEAESNRSHDYSQSTVELNKQRRGKSKTKISQNSLRQKDSLKSLKQQNQRMEQSIRMIWQCMGEIWENDRNRTAQTLSQQHRMEQLAKSTHQTHQELLQLKLDLQRGGAHGQSLHGLRS